MNSYHRAWLAAHPDRTAGWLQERLTDGFEVHHLDNNPLNDDPLNLVLIEGADHMRLHGLPFPRAQSAAKLSAIARLTKIPPEKRSEIARNAAMKRHHPNYGKRRI